MIIIYLIARNRRKKPRLIQCSSKQVVIIIYLIARDKKRWTNNAVVIKRNHLALNYTIWPKSSLIFRQHTRKIWPKLWLRTYFGRIAQNPKNNIRKNLKYRYSLLVTNQTRSNLLSKSRFHLIHRDLFWSAPGPLLSAPTSFSSTFECSN